MEDHLDTPSGVLHYTVLLVFVVDSAVVNTTLLPIAGAILLLEGESVGVGSPTQTNIIVTKLLNSCPVLCMRRIQI